MPLIYIDNKIILEVIVKKLVSFLLVVTILGMVTACSDTVDPTNNQATNQEDPIEENPIEGNPIEENPEEDEVYWWRNWHEKDIWWDNLPEGDVLPSDCDDPYEEACYMVEFIEGRNKALLDDAMPITRLITYFIMEDNVLLPQVSLEEELLREFRDKLTRAQIVLSTVPRPEELNECYAETQKYLEIWRFIITKYILLSDKPIPDEDLDKIVDMYNYSIELYNSSSEKLTTYMKNH